MFSGGFSGFGGFPGFGGGGMSSQEQQPQQKKQVNTTEYYELLGVDKKATAEQIRKAFRKKALKEHPDKGGDPDKFKKITNAYQTLTNPEKRQLYDEYGEQGVQNGGPPGGGGMGDIFSSFFGGGGQKNNGPRKAKPKLVQVQVTLNDVYVGVMKNVQIERYRNCQECEGKGGKNVQKCTKCKGRGVVQKLVQLGPGMYTQTSQRCGECKGEGQIMKQADKCKTCKGQKIKKVKKTLQVSIEQGVPDYHDYIFTGESDQAPGIIAGDIYARVRIKEHKNFQRRGADLVIIKKISLLEALTGVTIEIEHLDGKKYTIATAPGEVLSNAQIKTVKGLGMPFYKDSMSHGNLMIQFLVDFPPKGSITPQKVEKLIKILGGMETEKPKESKKTERKILQDFNEGDLNQNPQGGKIREEHKQRGGAQQVRCESQ